MSGFELEPKKCILSKPMSSKKLQKFGISAKKDEDFHEWYTQVVLRSELLDYYDVRGFFVMRPTSMFIWSEIRKHFDDKIRALGVEECYFPTLVTRKSLEVEKTHLDNFSPELAWITRCGDKPLADPVALRPTSEAIMYPFYSRWLKTYRDLPLRLNQWCSVVRWEVKSTLPFIRGREFLWQEGHCAHFERSEAESETRTILELYASLYEDLLAVPVVRGVKSKNETFGGAEYTLTVEAFIPATGKGVQGATSHYLGQNFSRMFDVKVDADDGSGEPLYVHQNSWGLTTRAIGVAVMLHSDSKGFVCPPRVAKIQVVVVVCGIKKDTSAEDGEKLRRYASEIVEELGAVYRVVLDERENVSPGYKFNHWELRGVPLRIEVGFRDLSQNKVSTVRRDTGERSEASRGVLLAAVTAELEKMHVELYSKAEAELEKRTRSADNFDSFKKSVEERCIVNIPWCGEVECEKAITERTTVRGEDGTVVVAGAKSLCIPFDSQLVEGSTCIACGAKAVHCALFGRSYWKFYSSHQ